MSKVAIEAALLSALSGSAGLTGVTIEPYAGQIDPESLGLLAAKAPSIFVQYDHNEPAETDGNGVVLSWRAFFNLAVIAKSLRSASDAQHGAYDMLDAIADALVSGYTPGGDQVLFNIPGVVAYSSVWSIEE